MPRNKLLFKVKNISKVFKKYRVKTLKIINRKNKGKTQKIEKDHTTKKKDRCEGRVYKERKMIRQYRVLEKDDISIRPKSK